MSKEITIYDIAKELDVSPTTVSRALNDHPAVNKNTKQRIFDAASSMGYRSNLFASNLRSKRTNTIGVIVPMLNSHFQSSVIAGMEKVANQEGYNLIISQSLGAAEKEIANAKTMFNSRVDGLLVSLAHNTGDTSHFDPFFQKGVPVIFYDRIAEHQQGIGIVIDNMQAAYKATTHLIEQGCTRIAHISGSPKINVYAERLKGYKYALIDHNLPFDESYVLAGSKLNEEAGIEAARQILRMDPMPDGIFVSNDTCAASCIKALKQAGKSVPEDIAVVGFNNDSICGIVEPSLSTVDYPGYEMGEVAVRSLLNLINGVSDAHITNTITLRSELIVRESSTRKAFAARSAADAETQKKVLY
ncbi:LacI family transcriptional regulator [Pontibacter ummariensis]|uniref:Transcriptional regulator, LacI family n=1 Tax=Pontibacter ummariensis TaxID=1610492 RepID=A0A239DNM6_9BACT|nr:LacI family DNA-binding transcriptional regulator [Pontibacter ummariensis]PRY13862.1 LacI family transcriptional regulator [Pontibacter ummariensis]SNS33343.1 transcriptional regulator, LacI family [Pontibacter ummariensis]